MQLIKVNSKTTKKAFLDFPKELHKNDPNWVCPLDIEIESTFDPEKNGNFKDGDAMRWVLTDKDGKLIGRIGAFYNRKTAMQGENKQPTGGCGFFECIDNQEAANALFDTAKKWLSEHGMEAMDGPINFGENFVNWGLLIDGYTQQGYGMLYTPPYYKTLFENYGFQDYFKQFSYHIDLNKPFSERQEKFARFVMRKPNYRWESLDFSNHKKYVKDAVEIYNTAWADFHADFHRQTEEDFEKIFLNAKMLLVEDFIVFAYDEDRPIGMIVSFPDFNQAFKKLKNGKLTLINKLKLLYHKKKSITRIRQVVSGVIPEYQKAGIIGPLFLKMADACRKHGITEIEMGWVGDYNKTVNKLYKQMDNTHLAKTHATYRYLFDREKPFERFSNMGTEKAKRQWAE